MSFQYFFKDILCPRKRNTWAEGGSRIGTVGTNGLGYSNTFYLTKVQTGRKYRKISHYCQQCTIQKKNNVFHIYMNAYMDVYACGLYVTFVYKHACVLMLYINICSHSCTHMAYGYILAHIYTLIYASVLICLCMCTCKTLNDPS